MSIAFLLLTIIDTLIDFANNGPFYFNADAVQRKQSVDICRLFGLRSGGFLCRLWSWWIPPL